MQHRLQALAPSNPVPVLARPKTLLVQARCIPRQAQVQHTLPVLARCTLPQVNVETVGTTEKEPKQIVAVAEVRHRLQAQTQSASVPLFAVRKTLLVLARCASQQAQVQRTLLMPARCVPPQVRCSVY